MKRIVLSFAALALLIGNYAYATTYTYTGANYTEAYGVLTTDMQVTGTITTSSPIPPNSGNFDIRPILTSWSFNDGVSTISTPNSDFAPWVIPTVDTDADGNITWSTWAITNTPIATAVDELNDFIYAWTTYSSAYPDSFCLQVTDGVCDSWAAGESYGRSFGSGVWVTTVEPIFADGFESPSTE